MIATLILKPNHTTWTGPRKRKAGKIGKKIGKKIDDEIGVIDRHREIGDIVKVLEDWEIQRKATEIKAA